VVLRKDMEKNALGSFPFTKKIIGPVYLDGQLN
jgi:hypothetical protein